mgnify:CR=1 FL=1
MKSYFLLLVLIIALNGNAQNAPELSAGRWLNTEQKMSLEHLQGKVVLLDFWGIWCKPCVEAIPKLTSLNNTFDREVFQVITVHTPKRSENLKEVFRENDFTLATMVDKIPKGETAPGYYGVTSNQYGVKAYPSYILIDKNGRIVGNIRSNLPEADEIRHLISIN